VELENLSVSIVPDVALKEKGPSPFEPGPYALVKLLFDLSLLGRCR
jgi:hypothetical protein